MMIFSLNADSAAELPLRRRPSVPVRSMYGRIEAAPEKRKREGGKICITLNLKSTKDEMRPMKCESKNL